MFGERFSTVVIYSVYSITNLAFQQKKTEFKQLYSLHTAPPTASVLAFLALIIALGHIRTDRTQTLIKIIKLVFLIFLIKFVITYLICLLNKHSKHIAGSKKKSFTW